jgi:hypothetical protein
MPYSRADDMRNRPQGLSRYLDTEKVRETASETRFQANDGLGRYIINNQKENQS